MGEKTSLRQQRKASKKSAQKEGIAPQDKYPVNMRSGPEVTIQGTEIKTTP